MNSRPRRVGTSLPSCRLKSSKSASSSTRRIPFATAWRETPSLWAASVWEPVEATAST